MQECTYTNLFEMENIQELPIFSQYKGKKILDFEKVIAVPVDLQVYYDVMVGPRSLYAYFMEYPDSPVKQEMMKKYVFYDESKYVVRYGENWDFHMKEGRLFVQNYVRFGAVTAGEWKIKNWNTYDAKNCVIHDNSVSFDSVEGIPFPIAEQLSRQYRFRELKHSFVIRGECIMKGMTRYLDGKPIENELFFSERPDDE